MSYHIALIADNHFVITEKGEAYVNGTYTQQYLSRFTSNFDKVTVIARGHKAGCKDDITKLRLSGGDRVTFCCLQDFVGVGSYIKNRNKLKREIKKSLAGVDAVFVRMPCILTTISLECANELKLPTMIDVGADPASIYLSNKKSVSRSIVSAYLKKVCKKSCLNANGVSYVTERILQSKYPNRSSISGESINYFSAAISNVDISKDFYFSKRKYEKKDKVKLLHISNNIPNNSGKGHIESLSVVRELCKRGIDSEIFFLGDGDGITELKEISTKFGISDKVKFIGRIADRDEYRKYLMNSDIFLFPSHSEGLPRVLIEAMATGLVCVSSNVDGIPELLNENDIFDYYDIDGMSSRIEYYVSNILEMNKASERNYATAKKYSNEQLKLKYDTYYEKVRKLIDHKRN